MFNRILIVCVGNVCRSPMGECLLRALMPGKEITSAGIGALVGKPADKIAATVVKEHGFDMGSHKAQQLTSALCREHDLILVMEKCHVNAVSDLAPESRGKIMLLSHFYNKQDIPDPFKQSKEAFDHVFSMINHSCNLWSKKLAQ